MIGETKIGLFVAFRFLVALPKDIQEDYKRWVRVRRTTRHPVASPTSSVAMDAMRRAKPCAGVRTKARSTPMSSAIWL